MKTKIFNRPEFYLALLVLCALFIIPPGCKKLIKPTVVFESELKATVPDILTVYQYQPSKWNKDSLNIKFGMLNPDKEWKFAETGDGLIYRSKFVTLFFSPKTGAEIFIDSLRTQAVVPGRYPVMAEKQVIELAKGFVVKKLGIKASEFKYLKTQHLHNAIQGPDQKTVETIDESIAVFSRLVNGTEVIGDGGFIRIHFDNQGNVIKYQKVWRDWQVFKKEIKIIPYAIVKEDFVKKMTGRMNGKQTVKVIDIGFGYYERGFLQEQAYLQPAYVFKTVFVDAETKQPTAARLEVMPAIEQVFEPLVIEQNPGLREEARPPK